MRIKDQLSPRSYGQYIHLKVLFLILLLCLTLVIALVAIVCGSSGMPIGAVLRTLAGGGSTQEFSTCAGRASARPSWPASGWPSSAA